MGAGSSIQQGDVCVTLSPVVSGTPGCAPPALALWQHWHSDTLTVMDSMQIILAGHDSTNNAQCFARALMKDGSVRVGRMPIAKEGYLQGRAAFAYDGIEVQLADNFDVLVWREGELRFELGPRVRVGARVGAGVMARVVFS